jgi:glycosyltransferase involved in cell wall biosynthesis
VPATHGGFETFADHLSRYLVARGWDVTVYCQHEGRGRPYRDDWRGVTRVIVPVSASGAAGTVQFDVVSTALSLRDRGVHLVLGYNTAFLNSALRLAGRRVVMNMDGLEWKRGKWSAAQRTWLRANEFIGAKTAQHLVADHPRIAEHLTGLRQARAITTIPYGSDSVTAADEAVPRRLGLEPGEYYLTVARIEPENSLLEIVTALSGGPEAKRVVVLGPFDPAGNGYHASIAAAAGPNCSFPGPVYEPTEVQALRFHAFAYVHGHTVGGTNPSLVEAMGAGNAVLAHDNDFNRWVAADGASYFRDAESLRAAASALEADPVTVRGMADANRARHASTFTWETVLAQYESVLGRAVGDRGALAAP